MRSTAVPTLLLLVAVACGSDKPTNVAGTYSVNTTVQKNDCGILGKDPGSSSTGVTVAITQDGSQVSAQVQGVAGIALQLGMGSDTFTGHVSGSSLDLAISGTMAGSQGTCAYTRNARLEAKLVGDALSGTLTYTYATNKAADCGTLSTCQDVQLMNGTRPPTVSP
jgi:hypothetical protein